MSRPQFNNNASSQSGYMTPGVPYQGQGVVNGGLIDFQDNTQRGLPAPDPYSSMMHSGMVLPGVAAPAVLHQGGLGLSGQSGVGGNCFSGPPSFIHISGTTYRPVEPGDPLFVAGNMAAPATLPDTSVTAETHVSTIPSSNATVNTKILSEDELNRIVDSRVRARVEAQVSGYLGKKVGPSPEGGYRDSRPSEVARRYHPSYSDDQHVESDRHSRPEPRIEHEREDKDSRYRVERNAGDGESRYRSAHRVERARDEDISSHPSRMTRSGEPDDLRRGSHTARSYGMHDAEAESSPSSIRRHASASSYADDQDMMEAADRVRSANASMSRRITVAPAARRGEGMKSW